MNFLSQKKLEEYLNSCVDIPSDDTFWMTVVQTVSLSEDFIEEYEHNFYLSDLIINQILSEEFLRKRPSVDWTLVSRHQKLSENFIREYASYLDWYWLSWGQELPERLIEEYEDLVDWCAISSQQELSEDFIKQKLHRLNTHTITLYQELSEDFIKQNDWVDISSVLLNEKTIKNLSFEFITNNVEYVTNIKLFKDMLSEKDYSFLLNLYNIKK